MSDVSELRRKIEDFALRIAVAEPAGAEPQGPPEWVPSLESIRESAQNAHAEQVAVAAASLIAALQRAQDGRGDAANSLSAELLAGVACLQEAAERETPTDSVQVLPPAQDPELMGDFILESREHLAAIETQVLTLERDPANSEALNAVFRGFHTIKGLAGFLELWEVQKFTHEVETLLDRARESQLTITTAVIDLILESADYLRRWVSHLESVQQGRPSEAPPRNDGLLERIRARLSDSSGAEQQPPEDLARMAVAVAPEAPAPNPSAPAVLAAPDGAVAPVVSAAPTSAPLAGQRQQTLAVKVNTAKLDYLADMAGEMVIAETLVCHDPDLEAVKSPRLQRKLAQLTRITAELQKTAMSMRLVPIGPLFQRMARLVRDLARQFGKQVEMETEGDEIELDRTIVEELADPLLHMVRNSMDHGLESPDDRRAKGKNPVGRVCLKAHHQGGQVVVEIIDDGRGLDRDVIRAKAIQKGLISAEQELSDNEVFNLIFHGGFTTAPRVTDVSGRGVGMDVVRRHIEKLRGRIEIHSTKGQGSNFALKLPLTLAIIDGLVVKVGPERYIMPLFAVREMFRPGDDTVWTIQEREEMAMVRGTMLPVLRLYRKFRVTPRSEDPKQSVLVVAEVEGKRFCLLVDDLLGKQEVVIKSLGETFQNVSGVAGGAILGDGRVGLILDLDRLYKERAA